MAGVAECHSATHLPKSTNIWRGSATFGPASTNIGPEWAAFDQNRLNTANCGPFSTKNGPQIGQLWATKGGGTTILEQHRRLGERALYGSHQPRGLPRSCVVRARGLGRHFRSEVEHGAKWAVHGPQVWPKTARIWSTSIQMRAPEHGQAQPQTRPPAPAPSHRPSPSWPHGGRCGRSALLHKRRAGLQPPPAVSGCRAWGAGIIQEASAVSAAECSCRVAGSRVGPRMRAIATARSRRRGALHYHHGAPQGRCQGIRQKLRHKLGHLSLRGAPGNASSPSRRGSSVGRQELPGKFPKSCKIVGQFRKSWDKVEICWEMGIVRLFSRLLRNRPKILELAEN